MIEQIPNTPAESQNAPGETPPDVSPGEAEAAQPEPQPWPEPNLGIRFLPLGKPECLFLLELMEMAPIQGRRGRLIAAGLEAKIAELLQPGG